MSKQYILIGSSAASMGALHKLKQLDPSAHITIFSAEHELPYNKCLLADFLAGMCPQERLAIYRSAQQATLHLNTRIVGINAQEKTVTDHKGNSYSYDALFLGMGSSPWIPPLEGISTQGIFTFHTLADTLAIQAYLKKEGAKRAVVCGAGLSGLEAADALATQGLSVTIVEKNNQVLPSLLTKPAADFLHDHMRSRGIDLLLGQSIFSIEENGGRVTGAYLNDGNFISADLLIIATGLQANTQLCQTTGISYGKQGVIVDDYLQTSQPGIFAGGDLIQVTDTLTGNQLRSCMWPDAMQQGMFAACAMAGQPKAYAKPAIIVSSAFFGLKFAKAGVLLGQGKTAFRQGFYHEIGQKEGVLTGFQMLGTKHDLSLLRRFILTKQPFLDNLDGLF